MTMPMPLFARPLLPHPSEDWAGDCRVDVAGHWEHGALVLRYRVASSGPGALVLPPPHPPGAADGLWQHTCCEAFVSAAESATEAPTRQAPYSEYNWSPSGQWAHYSFHAERQRDAAAAPFPTGFPIACEQHALHWVLQTQVPLPALPAAGPAGWWLGLSVVLEHRGGRRSHWALRHPCPQPDFHHPAARALQLLPHG